MPKIKKDELSTYIPPPLTVFDFFMRYGGHVDHIYTILDRELVSIEQNIGSVTNDFKEYLVDKFEIEVETTLKDNGMRLEIIRILNLYIRKEDKNYDK